MTVLAWDTTPVVSNAEEALLLLPLLEILRRRRWIGPDSFVRTELPWNGRRVDLATMGKSGVTGAYELKLGSFQRVLEQAMYNRLSFDRSWVVISEMPLPRNLAQAREHGVGVILSKDSMRLLLPARLQRNSAVIRVRLKLAIGKGL